MMRQGGEMWVPVGAYRSAAANAWSIRSFSVLSLNGLLKYPATPAALAAARLSDFASTVTRVKALPPIRDWRECAEATRSPS